MLEPGDSWVVPRGARHRYVVLDSFTALEATHPPSHVPPSHVPPSHVPPSHVHGRDDRHDDTPPA